VEHVFDDPHNGYIVVSDPFGLLHPDMIQHAKVIYPELLRRY
jgi:hypothetical protein